LISDVPVALYLSGGLDSSSILATLNKLKANKVMTYSIDVGDDKRTTDAFYAKKIASHYGFENKSFHYDFNDNISSFLEIVSHLDEPLADPAALPTYFLSKEVAKTDTKVVLNGAGGDELLGGYHHYKFVRNIKYLKLFPSFISKCVTNNFDFSKLASLPMFKSTDNYLLSYGNKGLERFLDATYSKGLLNNYTPFISIFDAIERHNLIKPSYFSDFKMHNLSNLNNIKLKDPTYHLLDSEMKQFLVDDVLTMTDSLTMANSLEARQPFLDTKLVSFVYSLPIKMRYNKGILKNTIGKSLPGYITKRKKEGFFMPIDTIIMNNLSFFKNFLFNNNSGIFNEWYIEKLFRNFNYSRFYYARQIWTLFNFEVWHRFYIRELKNSEVLN